MQQLCFKYLTLFLFRSIVLRFVAAIIIFFLALRPVVPVMEYLLNYDQIVKEYCINRMMPELMCNGKCYLFGELSKTSDGDVSGIYTQTVKIVDICIFPDEFSWPEIVESVDELTSIFNFKDSYSYMFHKQIFRPPIWI